MFGLRPGVGTRGFGSSARGWGLGFGWLLGGGVGVEAIWEPNSPPGPFPVTREDNVQEDSIQET